jgi:mRNA interferase MazF
MTFMPSYSKYDVILVRYPFSDRSNSKVRPAVVVNNYHPSQDIIIVPLTSQISSLLSGEFILSDWRETGLNVASAVKGGLYTLHEKLVVKAIGKLSERDCREVQASLQKWLN